MVILTRLTYNCAHLRSTKESLTIEYLRRKLYFFVVEKKNVEGKYLEKEKILFWGRRKRRKIFLGEFVLVKICFWFWGIEGDEKG